MATTERDILDFGIFVDIRDSLKAIEQFQRQMDASMKAVAKSSGNMGKAAEKAAEKATKASEDQTDAVKDVVKSYAEESKAIQNVEQTLEALRKMSAKAHAEEKEQIEDQIKGLEAKLKAHVKAAKAATKAKIVAKKAAFGAGVEKLTERLKTAGEALVEPLQNFLQRDAKGLVASSFKLGGKTLALSLKHSSKHLKFGGGVFQKAGDSLAARGRAKGGLGGAAMKGGALAMQGLGKAMGGIGKSLEFLGKLGPVLGVVGGAVVGLIKLFIDADSMVKEFNKSIMDSASNAEFLAGAGGNVNTAMAGISNTLDGLRAAAMDYETNMKLGITKDQHVAVINVLNQEGVSLSRINDEAEQAGKSVRELATQLVTTGVTYSRAFGVPLQEINQLQARMMTEMGRSLGETQQAFAMMTLGATQSGIASNKFFAMIRGVSADLSLYNLRLEDSVGLLSKLGKVMSPENAGKFLQSIMSMGKGMGRQQKLQMGLMAGAGNLSRIVTKDIERDSKNLMEKISKQTQIPAEQLSAAFAAEGPKGFDKFMKDVPEDARGALMESLMDLKLKSSRASKGTYGQAQAISDLSPGALLEVMDSALTRFSPGKSIADAVGSMGLEGAAEALGLSVEQVDQMAKLELAVDMERDALLAQAEGDAAKQAAIQKMSKADIVNGFSEEMKKSLKMGEKEQTLDERMEKLAQLQGQKTQSIMQKLEVLVDWFMSKFYDATLGIWDSVLSVLSALNTLLPKALEIDVDSDRKKIAATRAAIKHGSNAELSNMAQAEGDLTVSIAGSDLLKQIENALQMRAGNVTKQSDLETEIMKYQAAVEGGSGDPIPLQEERKKHLELLQAQLEAVKAQTAGITKMSGNLTKVFDSDALVAALQMDTGFQFNKKGAESSFRKDIEDGVSFEVAAAKTGATPEQIATAISKAAIFGGDENQRLEGLSAASAELKKIRGLDAPASEKKVETGSPAQPPAQGAPVYGPPPPPARVGVTTVSRPGEAPQTQGGYFPPNEALDRVSAKYGVDPGSTDHSTVAKSMGLDPQMVSQLAALQQPRQAAPTTGLTTPPLESADAAFELQESSL
jgi:hypothetical protein